MFTSALICRWWVLWQEARPAFFKSGCFARTARIKGPFPAGPPPSKRLLRYRDARKSTIGCLSLFKYYAPCTLKSQTMLHGRPGSKAKKNKCCHLLSWTKSCSISNCWSKLEPSGGPTVWGPSVCCEASAIGNLCMSTLNPLMLADRKHVFMRSSVFSKSQRSEHGTREFSWIVGEGGEHYAAIERDSEKARNPLSQEQKRRQTLFHIKEKCWQLRLMLCFPCIWHWVHWVCFLLASKTSCYPGLAPLVDCPIYNTSGPKRFVDAFKRNCATLHGDWNNKMKFPNTWCPRVQLYKLTISHDFPTAPTVYILQCLLATQLSELWAAMNAAQGTWKWWTTNLLSPSMLLLVHPIQ